MFVMPVRRRVPATGSRPHGFSMVELMVAMVLGLIVVAAVVNLVMSIIQSNNATIQSTRLTQELRATVAVIASDIKRARSVADPFRNPAVVGGNPYRTVDTLTDPKCVRYAYYNSDPDVTEYYHSISLTSSTTKPGSVMLHTADDLSKVECRTNKGERLNSRFIDIEDLTFQRDGRRIRITVVGKLVDNPDIKRTLSQDIFIRSLAGN